MHTADLIFVILMIVAVIGGYTRGFVIQLFSLVGTLLAIIMTNLFYAKAALLIQPFLHLKELNDYITLPIPIPLALSVNQIVANIIAYTVLFILIKIIIRIIANALNIITKLPIINLINRLAGSALSAVEVVIIVVIIVNIASLLPIESTQNVINNSVTSQFILTEFSFIRDNMVEKMFEMVSQLNII